MTNTKHELSHSDLMNTIYEDASLEDGLDLWSRFFHRSDDQRCYSEYRHSNIMRNRYERRAWEIAFHKGDRVLDIGCGTGYLIEKLKEEMPFILDCVGIDISANAVMLARKRDPDARFYQADSEQLPFSDESFDVVLFYSVFQYITNPNIAINEAYRVLKNGGRILFTIHKSALDIFIIPSILHRLYNLIRWRWLQSNHITYSQSLSKTRKKAFSALNFLSLDWIYHADIGICMEFMLYRKLGINRQSLFRLATHLHRLPYRYFKDLELFVCRKKISC